MLIPHDCVKELYSNVKHQSIKQQRFEKYLKKTEKNVEKTSEFKVHHRKRLENPQ